MSARLRYTLLGLALLLVLALVPFRPLKIEGSSMSPTFHSGETYLLDHFYWKLGGLRRGDIVVVEHGEEKWVKRLVGMPGDTLQLRRTPYGWITEIVNLTLNPAGFRRGPGYEIRQVQDDEIFVIGDNLNRSTDSTNQEAGAFKLNDVVGVARTFTFRRDFPFRQHL